MKLKAICGSIQEYASVVIYSVDFVKSMMISGGIGLSALCTFCAFHPKMVCMVCFIVPCTAVHLSSVLR